MSDNFAAETQEVAVLEPLEVRVAPDVIVVDEDVERALSEVKHEFNRWYGHFLGERANWPIESVNIWSTGQTLHLSNLNKYGLGDDKSSDQKENIARAIVGYLHQETEGGLRKWLSDRIEEYGSPFFNEKNNSKYMPLVEKGVKFYPDLEEKWNKVSAGERK